MKFIERPDVARRMRPAAALASALLAGAAFAASNGEHREHEAHEHGHGTLDIVVEGEELVIELRIPAVNVVGFEHAPRDDAEREAIRQALVPFGDAASVFLLPEGAECEVESAETEIFSMEHEDEHEEHDAHAKEEHEEHEEHAKEEHEEHEEHAKEEHEEHAKEEHEEHDEHEADAAEEAHSELHATYRFHCHAPARLDRIDVRVFEHLRDAEEIDVRVVTATAQLAMELHPDSTVVELAP